MRVNRRFLKAAVFVAVVLALNLGTSNSSQAGVTALSSTLQGNLTLSGAEAAGNDATFQYIYPSNSASQSGTINPLSATASGQLTGLYDNYANDRSGVLSGSFGGTATFASASAGNVSMALSFLTDDVANGGINLGNDAGRSGFIYNFSTDQAGSIAISWNTVASGHLYYDTYPSTMGITQWMVRVDENYSWAPINDVGSRTVDLAAAGNHLLEFRNQSNIGGGLLDTGWNATGSFSFVIAAGDGNVAPIPEPDAYAMLLAGLGLLGYVAHRRKQMDAATA